MPSKNSEGECVYCGRVGAMTRDHIPPQNLFPSPRPTNLITVPSCQECNKGFDLDDEYFRLAVTTGIDKEAFQRESNLSVEAIKKLKEPSKINFARRMLASFSKKPVYTPSGLYLGQAGVLEIAPARVVSTVRRIIRGLFFHCSGRRLPTSVSVWVWSLWFGQANDPDPELMAALAEIFEALCKQAIHGVGEGAFRYSYLMDSEDRCGSAWWLSFYRHRNFVGGTLTL